MTQGRRWVADDGGDEEGGVSQPVEVLKTVVVRILPLVALGDADE